MKPVGLLGIIATAVLVLVSVDFFRVGRARRRNREDAREDGRWETDGGSVPDPAAPA